MSAFLDFITIAVFIAIIVTSYQKGLIRSVIEFAGYLVSSAVALVLSIPTGNWLYSTFLRPFVYGRIQGYIYSSINRTGAQSVMSHAGKALNTTDLSAFLNKVPEQFKTMLGSYNLNPDTLHSVAGNAVQSGASSAAEVLTNTVVAPIATAISRDIAFTILFSLCFVVVRFIAGLTGGVSKIPVIGTVNRVGGAAVGFLKALFIMFLISTLISVLAPVASLRRNSPVTQDAIDRTTVFKIIYDRNPLTQILLKK